MGIYIKGMEMPKSCSNCLFFVDGLYDENDELCSACLAKKDNSPSGCGYGEIDGIDHTTERMWWCPLVDVSEPHGDLIDRDALEPDIFHDWNGYKVPDDDYSEKCICNAPVVIEAEGE